MSYIFRDEVAWKFGVKLALHAQKKCTYEFAWMLFRPGSYVYSHEADNFTCFIVHSIELLRLVTRNTKAYSSEVQVRPQDRYPEQEFKFLALQTQL